ncbi:MAG: response regulator [Dehalococcoidales bacterium]|nr:response regulator [Dehalococcoidales bacterium]
MESGKILIVDDDSSIRKFLQANLEARGYSVLSVQGGPEALHLLSEKTVDLILLDIMMPEMDGFEVCRRIRNNSQVPVIMLSAREGEGDSQKSLDSGANDYVTKPFRLKEILGKIRSYC